MSGSARLPDAGEDWVMRTTFKATMLRAAEIVERITFADVLEAQAVMLAEGVSLEKVAKIDRAMLAAQHLRACAEEMATREAAVKDGLA